MYTTILALHVGVWLLFLIILSNNFHYVAMTCDWEGIKRNQYEWFKMMHQKLMINLLLSVYLQLTKVY